MLVQYPVTGEWCLYHSHSAAHITYFCTNFSERGRSQPNIHVFNTEHCYDVMSFVLHLKNCYRPEICIHDSVIALRETTVVDEESHNAK